ncbi:MAG: 3-hydroxyacyl-CoA dehydrogenase family protein [bacterium]
MKYIGIVGSGVEAAAIARLCAQAQFDVVLYDVNDTLLRRALERMKGEFREELKRGSITQAQVTGSLDRIHPRTHIDGLSHCDLILEMVTEDLRVKRDMLMHLEATARSTTILISTSTRFSISSIASAAKKPDRVLGVHFLFPMNSSKVVELVPTTDTIEETIQRTSEFLLKLRKQPILVKDSPGSIVGRLTRIYYGEAIRILHENVAGVNTIDSIMKSIGGFPQGPFAKLDEIGLDVDLQQTQALFEQTSGDERYRPHPLQKQMVESGKLGKKTERGFYPYPTRV